MDSNGFNFDAARRVYSNLGKLTAWMSPCESIAQRPHRVLAVGWPRSHGRGVAFGAIVLRLLAPWRSASC
jgi:hypothetical protein